MKINKPKPKLHSSSKSKEIDIKDKKKIKTKESANAKGSKSETTKHEHNLNDLYKKLDVDSMSILKNTSNKLFRSDLETIQLLIFYGKKYLDLYDDLEKLNNHVMTFESYVEGNTKINMFDELS